MTERHVRQMGRTHVHHPLYMTSARAARPCHAASRCLFLVRHPRSSTQQYHWGGSPVCVTGINPRGLPRGGTRAACRLVVIVVYSLLRVMARGESLLPLQSPRGRSSVMSSRWRPDFRPLAGGTHARAPLPAPPRHAVPPQPSDVRTNGRGGSGGRTATRETAVFGHSCEVRSV